MRYLVLLAAILGAGYLIGCGSGSNNNSVAACPAGYINSNNTCVVSSVTTTSYQGTCQVGYVQTTQGCLPQNSCPVGQGMNTSNQCVASSVAVTGVTGVGGSCQGTCQAGYTQTQQYGCQPQGSCAVCQAFVNNTCVAGIQTATTGYGYGTPGYGTTGYGGYPGYGTPGYGTTGYGGYYPGYYPGYPPSFYPGYYGYGYSYGWGH